MADTKSPPRTSTRPAARHPARSTASAADRQLRPLLQDCRRLLSERGEANGPGIAAAIVRQIDALTDDQRTRFFDHLARDFSPDPQQVLAAALAYAKAPGQAANLIALTQAAEPPRQELFRRLNRAPGGTAAIVRLRRALLERLPRHPALAGVEHEGNFLIKRVAEQLKRELPQLRTFCTLSPIPGLMGWLHKAIDPTQVGSALAGMPAAATERAVHALALLRGAAGDDLHALLQHPTLAALPADAHHALWRLAALYLVNRSPQPGGDPVARFHLDNGARLERLNAQANLAPKGLKQSAGLMINDLYDLGRIEHCHDRFVQGRVVHSRALSALL